MRQQHRTSHENAPRGTRLSCLHAQGSRTRVIAANSSTKACVTVFHHASVDRSDVLDLSSSLASASFTCFIMGNMAFHKTCIEWNSLRLHVYQMKYLPRDRPEEAGDPKVRYRAWKRRMTSMGAFCARRGHIRGNEPSVAAHRGRPEDDEAWST